jgi:hypothetical protein
MPFRRSRQRWEGNMKMDIKTIGWETVDWVYLAMIGTRGGLF